MPASRFVRYLDLTILAAAALLVWQLLHWYVGDTALASPLQTVLTLQEMLSKPEFLADIRESLHAFVAAVSIGGVAGVLLGLFLGMNRLAGDTLEPVLSTLYSIPKVAFYPIVLSIFGLGISARVAFGIMHGIFPITILCMNAVQNVRPSLVRSAKVMRLNAWQTFVHILFPSAVGGIVTALRIGTAVTLLGVLIGEMFSSKRGLGFRLINAIEVQDVSAIMAVAILLSAFALAINSALVYVERRIQRRF